MSRMLVAATVFVLLVGCGDDDDSASNATSDSASATTGPSVVTADATSISVSSTAATATQPSSTDGPTPASVAATLTEAGLGCEDIHTPEPDETSATMVPEPEGDEGECTIRDHPITITVLADSEAVEMAEAQLKTVIPEFLKAFGVEEAQFVRAGPDDRVLVSVNSMESSSLELTDEMRAISEEVADALDGDVVTIQP